VLTLVPALHPVPTLVVIGVNQIVALTLLIVFVGLRHRLLLIGLEVVYPPRLSGSMQLVVGVVIGNIPGVMKKQLVTGL